MSKGMDVNKLNEFLSGGKPVDKAVPAQDKCDGGKCRQDSAVRGAGIGGVSSEKSGKARKYLDLVAARDSGTVDLTRLALNGWKNPVNPKLPQVRERHAMTPLGYPLREEKTLEEHDRRWHNGHYDGGACKYRKDRGIETFEKKDAPGEKADKLNGKASGASAALWDGELSKQSDDAIEAIGRKVFEDVGDSVYDRMGDGGKVVMANGGRVRSVPASELSSELDDAIRETIIDELPESAKDYDRADLVKRVAQKMDSYVKNFMTWDDLEGKGEEYVDEA